MSDTVKRLSKNTVFLYIRMIFLMIINLYASRVLLRMLGVTDFGVYSVVGSITATFYSLRSVFSEAIQRYLNYEKGKANTDGEKQIFNIAVILHVIIAFTFVILVEVGGLWLLDKKLVIDADRIGAAYRVFHFSVLSSFLSILIIPYDALIIANEKMNTYAWVSMADGILKLFIVLGLPFLSCDKLVSYAALLALVPLLNLAFYVIYCHRFRECRYELAFDKSRMKEVFSFSGWSFGGNLVYTLTHEGLNLLINMFGGVVNNAARNIAYQVRSAANQVSNNTLLASKPYLLQNAALLGKEELLKTTSKIARVNFFIMSITCAPIVCFCQQLLTLWLGEVPENSVIFTQLVVIGVWIRSLHGPLGLFYMGVGKIKRMVIIESGIDMVILVLCYFLLYAGAKAWVVYAVLIGAEVLIILSLIYNIRVEIEVKVSLFIRHCIKPLSILFISSLGLSLVLSDCVLNNSVSWMLYLVSLLFTIGFIIICIMNNEEKGVLRKVFCSLLRKNVRT